MVTDNPLKYVTVTAWILTAIMLLQLQSCATFSDQSVIVSDRVPGSIVVLPYRVQRGDTLATISRRLTGSMNNWPEIAEFNALDNPGSLQAGEVLMVPSKLLLNSARVDASLIEYQPVTSAVATSPEPVTATTTMTTASSVGTDFQPRSLPGRVQEPVEVEAVDINRDFRILRTYQETRETEQGQLGLLEIAGESEFRNVYVQPFNHSPLLMRVETGMTFRIEQVLDNWYRISTERGAGYVRSRDTILLNSASSYRQQLPHQG